MSLEIPLLREDIGEETLIWGLGQVGTNDDDSVILRV
jgi:hypothetical protein